MVDKLNEPKWKNDIVKTIWNYARETGLVKNGNLPGGLGEVVRDVRRRCDRCGKTPEKAKKDSGPSEIGIWPYQCCWVHTEEEDYCPHLCIECHRELQKQRPHDVISV
jgi:hypothetical protein